MGGRGVAAQPCRPRFWQRPTVRPSMVEIVVPMHVPTRKVWSMRPEVICKRQRMEAPANSRKERKPDDDPCSISKMCLVAAARGGHRRCQLVWHKREAESEELR